ncbi:flagella biosynthesis regulator Flk [Apirhabdus apintestini]|nr:flagella biosynthesis regulator Flk [Enterobacteriaceae bacterium CA-0114]
MFNAEARLQYKENKCAIISPPGILNRGQARRIPPSLVNVRIINDAPHSGAGARPPGDLPVGGPQSQPLTPQQRTALERIITRIVALTQQQTAEVWAGLKHAINLRNDRPLSAQHFPAAEHYLNQRLEQAQSHQSTRQTLQQLTSLLQQGNNRQAVSEFIRATWGQTVLSQLSPEQLKDVLVKLQNGQLAIPQPQQRPATDRPLLPVEHSALNKLAARLSATTGESTRLIWQSMMELSGVKHGDLIPARHYALLTTWLTARQTLTQQPAPNLHTLQAALKQPLESTEWREINDYAQQRHNVTPQTVLTPAQTLDILNHLFFKRAERLSAIRHEEEAPEYTPLIAPVLDPIKTLVAAHPGRLLIVLILVILFWLLI